jgi:hypothetical protein
MLQPTSTPAITLSVPISTRRRTVFLLQVPFFSRLLERILERIPPVIASPATPKFISSMADGRAGPGRGCSIGGPLPLYLVEICKVELTVFVPGVTVEGEKEHCNAAGRLEQERVISDRIAPPTGMTKTLAFPDKPDGISIAVGVALRLIVEATPGVGMGIEGPPQVEEKLTALENWFLRVGLPTAST